MSATTCVLPQFVLTSVVSLDSAGRARSGPGWPVPAGRQGETRPRGHRPGIPADPPGDDRWMVVAMTGSPFVMPTRSALTGT